MRTLVYVDKALVLAIGALLVGSSQSKQVGAGGSLNMLLTTHVDLNSGITRELKDLLPEQICYRFYDKMPHRFEDTKEATLALANYEHNHIMPGTPVAVCGILSFPELASVGTYDPFHPPSIDVETFEVYGDRCFVG